VEEYTSDFIDSIDSIIIITITTTTTISVESNLTKGRIADYSTSDMLSYRLLGISTTAG